MDTGPDFIKVLLCLLLAIMPWVSIALVALLREEHKNN